MTERHWIQDKLNFLKSHIRRKALSKCSTEAGKGQGKGKEPSATATYAFYELQCQIPHLCHRLFSSSSSSLCLGVRLDYFRNPRRQQVKSCNQFYKAKWCEKPSEQQPRWQQTLYLVVDHQQHDTSRLHFTISHTK